MKRLFTLALLSVIAAPLAAQQVPGSLRRMPVDGIVAVVGAKPILWSEVLEVVQQRRAAGAQEPKDSDSDMEFAKQVISDLVDEEILVQRAEGDTSIVVADADVSETVDQQIKSLRARFRSDGEFLNTLRGAGFGNQEEYKRWLSEQARRTELQQRVVQKMQRDGKMITVQVSDAEVSESYEKNKAQFPKRPPSITFHQIIVATQASAKARAAARAKADSILTELKTGGDFEQIAKRESMDPASKERGGDLGWNRRGQMVAEFDRVMFGLPPGQLSPVTETQYGFHIIKVDRVKSSEVKARHILIKPVFDSADVVRARGLADSVLAAWKAGAPFDTLVKKFHDPDEVEGILEPYPRDSLPPSYRTAIENVKVGEWFGPFEIPDPQRGVPKVVIARIDALIEAGDFTVAELRDRIRAQLSNERSYRRLLDNLRKETFVGLYPLDRFSVTSR